MSGLDLATSQTEWPTTPVPDAVKKFIDEFFIVMDNNTPDAGERLAADFFTPTASFTITGGTYVGTEEIKISRIAAWKVVTSRAHRYLKVYTCKEDASDLLTIGLADMGLINGKTLQGNFISRIVFEDVNAPYGELRMKLFQAWGDSGPLIRALQEGQ
ncbi:hypothetical protein A1O3_06672 [Capronia epimyces CBS 606.96]|uniref:SnoaL-like domain-containing protein n=1 Tax=Capronia epimyces CBS 606.96 TaxID=1182542 RepID=W9XQR3_9EURO|nr:uncharacterized protein A1O3_06672 [Capronia epimyces CBS 606.96]EXJ82857.1 hypothetical protein A1O3_06672 [Capronia epimyces CBS 606.96]